MFGIYEVNYKGELDTFTGIVCETYEEAEDLAYEMATENWGKDYGIEEM